MDPIEGDHGDFSFDLTARDGQKDDLTITYTPKHDPNGCKDIHLAQTVKTEAYDGDNKKVSEKDEDIFQENEFDHTRDDREDTGYQIDHHACQKVPYYDDHWEDGNATEDPPEPTEMDDGPWVGDDAAVAEMPFGGVVKPGIEKVIYRFETCAICKTTGVVLDCFTWI